MVGKRLKRVWAISDGIYDGIKEALRRNNVDVGEGIAVCQLVAGWLQASADAQITLGNTSFDGVPYFGEGSDE